MSLEKNTKVKMKIESMVGEQIFVQIYNDIEL
jgi:hypothetical protein